MDQYEVLRNPKKSQPEETIAERVNYYLLKNKNKENRNWNQNLDSKKAFNQICIVIGTIISCYQLLVAKLLAGSNSYKLKKEIR